MLDLRHLPGAHPDEQLVALLRRHWSTLLSLMASLAFVVILPPGAYFILDRKSVV